MAIFSGSVRGTVTFEGGEGKFNTLVLEDSGSTVGRNYEFNSSTVDANEGFGGVTNYTDVTDILLHASGLDDVANVESLGLNRFVPSKSLSNVWVP